ncbi:MAG TPA: rod shape-determining protein MreC [Fulvivirga sp.]|nr:rod shape-determining protein MreC [Fulvivirga sp.]
MQRLFLFLYNYRAFLTFLLLEVFCGWLIVRNNNYQGAKYFNSSAAVSANLLETSRSVHEYLNLKEVNEVLAMENARLQKQVEQYKQSLYNLDIRQSHDIDVLNQYNFISAKVINNSTRRFDNYITINKGLKQGIEPGMAVIDNLGIVGKVKNVSEHYSVITSILHVNTLISSKLRSTGDLCTTKWDGIDPTMAEVLYLPRHVAISIGDSVVTSGYNAVFPENIPVGVVESFEKTEDALFYSVKIRLASNLNKLSYVYLVKNNMKIEQDSIQNITFEK